MNWTQTEAAAHCHVSVGTIKRREAEAIAAGLMRRFVTDDYQRSYVVLSPDTGGGRSQCIETPQTDDAAPTPAPAIVYDDDVRSQLVSAHQDAVNDVGEKACNERARVEITHSPGRVATDEWAGIDQEIAEWKATTRDGRHFAQIEARHLHDLANIERLRPVLSGPPSRGACVLSTAPIEPAAPAPAAYNPFRAVPPPKRNITHESRLAAAERAAMSLDDEEYNE